MGKWVKYNMTNIFYFLFHKIQLSQMNTRDGIVLQTEVCDKCDKLAVDRRRYCQLID